MNTMTHSQARAARRKNDGEVFMRQCDEYAKAQAAKRAKAKARIMAKTTGYRVYLFGEVFWHRTLQGATGRIANATGYCQHPDAQIIDCATGNQI